MGELTTPVMSSATCAAAEVIYPAEQRESWSMTDTALIFSATVVRDDATAD